MEKREIEKRIQELKMDYIRLQNDLEKLESVDGNLSPLEKRIAEIEAELKILNQQLKALSI